jgi:three-Cys-motif partner protein
VSDQIAKFDKIGYWSELKLEIVRDYAKEYSKILSNQNKFEHIYIDAFCGSGTHLSRRTGEFIPGSPLNALQIVPPFREYHLIDLDGDKVSQLRAVIGDRPDVYLYPGDCNAILIDHVFPRVRYEDYRRGLCLLDPYGLHLDWSVIETAGRMKSIEIFLNFPIMDMNRNALWHNQEGVHQDDIARMSRFWGDESWRGTAYKKSRQLNFIQEEFEKTTNDDVAVAFRDSFALSKTFVSCGT